MQPGSQTQAVLLLTAHFKKADRGEPKPLSTREWAKFAYWLKDHGLQPSSLLSEEPRHVLSGWRDHGITQERIEHLLRRGGALGLALEKWQRAGLWVLTRSDPEYPERLKKRLGLEAPPVLFGCGNKNLLGMGGIAVVGSRNASSDDLAFAAQLGADAASQGLSISSGGARGVDETAMLGALECEGTVVGVLADSLLRSATSAKYRRYLMSNDLALISPFSPEAGFNAGNAMARNRYIYCLADAGIVVAATRERGGTWNGAIENLKSGWVPLWVKLDSDPSSGNAELVRRGASWLPQDESALSSLLVAHERQASGPDSSETLPLARRGPLHPDASHNSVHGRAALEDAPSGMPVPPAAGSLDQVTFYQLFLDRMASLTAETPLAVDDLERQLAVTKTQLNAWIKRAVNEQRLKKLTRPVRYRWKGNGPSQTSLFGEG